MKFNLNGTFNSYSVSESTEIRGNFVLMGTGRKLIRPTLGNFAIQLQKDSGNLVLRVKDHRASELAALSSNYKVNVSFKLYKYENSWCKSNELIVSTTSTLDNGAGDIDLGALALRVDKNLSSDSEYFVEDVTVERLNTEYFSGQSNAVKSEHVKF